jgi:Ca-activated chloride channel family protein
MNQVACLRRTTKCLVAGAALLLALDSHAAGLLTPADGSLPALDLREHHVAVVIEDG